MNTQSINSGSQTVSRNIHSYPSVYHFCNHNLTRSIENFNEPIASKRCWKVYSQLILKWIGECQPQKNDEKLSGLWHGTKSTTGRTSGRAPRFAA